MNSINNMDNILYVVIPCYNEEEVLPETASRLKEKMNALIKQGKINEMSRLVFVNDGSKDKTWEIIKSYHDEDKLYQGINLSRNRGHQNALLAGLMTVVQHADMIISMDADLQDDINAMDEMIDCYHGGADIVYGVRNKRKTDTFFKRFTAQSFYKLMNLLGAQTVYNHADYRLMSKRAVQGLTEFKEVNLFLRGIVPMIGYNTQNVYYERNERFAGESKYPLKKMIAFAMEGITSLSVRPIRMILNFGIIISLIGALYLLYSFFAHFTGRTVEGWTSIVASVWLLGGINLLALGIIGEYIGKIYMESKERPRFIVETYLGDSDKEEA